MSIKGQFLQYLLVFFSLFFFLGCSAKKQHVEIYDLQHLPQTADVYSKNFKKNSQLQTFEGLYKEKYFRVWDINVSLPSVEDIQWPFKVYKPEGSFGANLQPLSQSFFDVMYERSNFEAYNSVARKGLSIENLNLRSFPTNKPLFKDPSLAGEGFPFDYLQNTTVAAYKPLFISHYSKDKEWVFVFSSFASGWIKSDQFVFLNDEQTAQFQDSKQIFLLKDNTPVYDLKGNFVFRSRVGMVLPLVKQEQNNSLALVYERDINQSAVSKEVLIDANISSLGKLEFNAKNITSIIDAVQHSTYGWGGLYGERDCSSLMRDIFTPFGLWLPRNSSQQSKIGTVFSLEGLSEKEKIATIKHYAIPFATLLYKRGHILLYLGTYEDKIIVFHDTWGVKTMHHGKEGRAIIGKAIFSSLKLGERHPLYDEEGEILKHLSSFNLLGY